jgi:hypothetical protein
MMLVNYRLGPAMDFVHLVMAPAAPLVREIWQDLMK